MPTIKEYMQKNVQTIEPDKTVCDAASLMEKHNITCLIVTENDKPTGIVSQKDIIFKVVAQKVSPEKMKVKEIMSSPIKSLPETKDLIEAAAMMNSSKIKHLPIITKDKLVGIITQTDVVRYIDMLHNVCL